MDLFQKKRENMLVVCETSNVELIYSETERTAFHQLSHYTLQILRESHKWSLADKLCASVATSDR